MEKTKSCKRKMRIAIGILLLEFAYMLFMGIGGVHATDETLPTVDGKLIHSIDHVEITSEMMNRYAKDMDPREKYTAENHCRSVKAYERFGCDKRDRCTYDRAWSWI